MALEGMSGDIRSKYPEIPAIEVLRDIVCDWLKEVTVDSELKLAQELVETVPTSFNSVYLFRFMVQDKVSKHAYYGLQWRCFLPADPKRTGKTIETTFAQFLRNVGTPTHRLARCTVPGLYEYNLSWSYPNTEDAYVFVSGEPK